MTIDKSYIGREVWTSAEAADYLRIDKRTLARWVERDGFPHPKKISVKKSLFLASEVREWLTNLGN